MSSLAEFRAANKAQFERAEEALHKLSREYVIAVAERLVLETSGEGNQMTGSEVTYAPTGRLRGGWNWVEQFSGAMTSKGLFAARNEDGPFSLMGEETVERIKGQLPEELPPVSYLENDVAYGHLIINGLGPHAREPNPFTELTAKAQVECFRVAMGRLGDKS